MRKTAAIVVLLAATSTAFAGPTPTPTPVRFSELFPSSDLTTDYSLASKVEASLRIGNAQLGGRIYRDGNRIAILRSGGYVCEFEVLGPDDSEELGCKTRTIMWGSLPFGGQPGEQRAYRIVETPVTTATAETTR